MFDKETLYVTDLDGTLLDTKETIPHYSLQVINHLIEKGMHFTYATARSLNSAEIVTKGLNTGIPAIVYNGAFIVNTQSKEILYECHFTSEQKERVKRLLDHQQIYPLVYGYREGRKDSHLAGMEQVSWFTAYENEGMRRYLDSRKGDKRLHPLSIGEDLYKGDVFYFTCIGEREALEPIYHELKDAHGYKCTLQQELYRTEYWLEIMPSEATKANGIIKLKELTGCNKIISFGDAINDIPMFQISDECYAVANAVASLKEIATKVIGSNTEEGVGKWFSAH